MTHDDDVERVARAIWDVDAPEHRMEWDEETSAGKERYLCIARAALSAMPPPELRIGAFVLRPSPNGIWIGRRGGEGGEFATEHVERVIAQFYRENF